MRLLSQSFQDHRDDPAETDLQELWSVNIYVSLVNMEQNGLNLLPSLLLLCFKLISCIDLSILTSRQIL